MTNNMLLIFGGMNMKLCSVARYKALYPPIRTHLIPLHYRNVWLHTNFNTIVKEASVNDRIHVHCLSGGTLQYTRFLRKYAELREKVITEVYDNPCPIDGIANLIHKSTRLSPNVSLRILKWTAPDPVAQSTYFLKQPLTNARRLVIQSSNDRISPPKNIDEMIDRWSINNVWANDCFHLHSLRTYPTTYKERVDELYMP